MLARCLKLLVMPILLVLAYALPYEYRMRSAHLPKDTCYFETHHPTPLQADYIDSSGHIAYHSITFLMICGLLFGCGFLVNFMWRSRIKSIASSASSPASQ